MALAPGFAASRRFLTWTIRTTGGNRLSKRSLNTRQDKSRGAASEPTGRGSGREGVLPKILIIEDEFFLADDCAKEAKLEVAGPFSTLDDAEAQIRNGVKVDAALVDVNLVGELIYPLLDELLHSGMPIVIYTGYDRASLPQRFRRLPVFTKPHDCSQAVAYLKSYL
jgi:hypothetical protein